MRLIFIYGLPATGKLTVATELVCLTGYKLFHNHLTVDLLLSVFEFGTPAFVTLREHIWLTVFKKACESKLPGMIFTFAPESTVDPGFVERATRTVEDAGGQITFVELVCPVSELKTRMSSSSRLRYQKLTSVSLFEDLHANGTFHTLRMPKPVLSLDTGRLTPAEAARAIACRVIPEMKNRSPHSSGAE